VGVALRLVVPTAIHLNERINNIAAGKASPGGIRLVQNPTGFVQQINRKHQIVATITWH